MTQAELAGTLFTKGFISLIETGRTRMSLRAAEIIATRLGTSISDLLREAGSDGARSIDLLMTRAELELRAGRLREARDFADAAVQNATGVLKARVNRIQALILLDARQPREAMTLLDQALRVLRTTHDPVAIARCLFDLARVHSRLDQRGEALNMALEAERLLLGGEAIDRTLELQVVCFIAGLYAALGDYGSADIRTERARALAEDVADPRAVAQLYESLAITRQEQGDFDAALAYATRALHAYEILGQRAMIGSAWNTIGWVYIQRQQFGRADEALAKAEQTAADTSDARLRGYVLQTKAELELARGHATRAVEFADASIAVNGSSERGRALSLLVRAQALAASDAPLSAVNAAFEQAFEALQPFGRSQVARAYELHFAALVKRERFREAALSAQRALQLTHPTLAPVKA